MGHAVANVFYRSKVGVAVYLDLVAQSSYVHIDSSGTPKAVNTPYVGEQLLAAEYPPHVFHEELEQLELQPGKVYAISAYRNLVSGLIKSYLSYRKPC